LLTALNRTTCGCICLLPEFKV